MYKIIKQKFSCYDFVEGDLLEWLAGPEPGQDGYGNEGDRAESGDQLSDEDESDENEISSAVAFKCISAAHEKNYQHHLEQAIYLAVHGQDKPVNVRIWPEQLNPMDPSAIDLDHMELDGHICWLYCF
jgi:hypothetical protein